MTGFSLNSFSAAMHGSGGGLQYHTPGNTYSQTNHNQVMDSGTNSVTFTLKKKI